MHILMISYWDFQRHGMQVTYRTPLYFAEAGHRVTFLVHSETTLNPWTDADPHPNLRVVRFDMPFKQLNRFRYLRRARQLIGFFLAASAYIGRNLRGSDKPDVLYAAEADAVLIGAWWRRLLRVPFVTRFYGVLRLQAEWDAQRGRFKRRGPVHLLSRLAITRPADLVIVTNDGSNGEAMIRAVNPRARRVLFLRNGVDARTPDPEDVRRLREQLQLAPDARVIMTVCRLDAAKGVHRAIRAMARWADRARDLNAVCLVVGDGAEKERLQTLADREGVADIVRFAGTAPHDEVWNYYALCDVFLSLYDETNVGNPLLEALCAGCCIVTLNNGGTAQLIQDGRNGRLIEVGDDDAIVARLADVLKDLLARPEERAILAQHAKQTAEQEVSNWSKRLRLELDAIEALGARA